jgi:hypothetical protein
MLLLLAIYAIIAVLALFVAVGVYLVIRSLRIAAREQRPERGNERRLQGLNLRQRTRRYVGPVKPEMALLNPVARVGVEFFCSLCGFPGLGWLISGRVAIGLLLFAVVPIFTWAVYPLYLSVSNEIMAGPYVALRYLPFLAVASAGLLAASQARSARQGRDGEAES